MIYTTPPTPDDDRWAAALEQPVRRTARRWLPRLQARSSEKTLYSVPRRFDIATLLVVSLAYSLLFSFFKVLGAPWPVFLFFGMLTVVIGVAQALFPYGNEPRWASMIAGFVYLEVWSIATAIVLQDWTGGLCGMVGAFVFGPPIGYITGAVEAGVFLLADKVRNRWFPDTDNSDAIANNPF